MLCVPVIYAWLVSDKPNHNVPTQLRIIGLYDNNDSFLLEHVGLAVNLYIYDLYFCKGICFQMGHPWFQHFLFKIYDKIIQDISFCMQFNHIIVENYCMNFSD